MSELQQGRVDTQHKSDISAANPPHPTAAQTCFIEVLKLTVIGRVLGTHELCYELWLLLVSC